LDASSGHRMSGDHQTGKTGMKQAMTTLTMLLALIGVLWGVGSAYASGPLFFGWDTPPTAFNYSYQTNEIGPPGCNVDGPFYCHDITVEGIRSGYSGGIYGVDANSDGIRDGSLTAEFEIVSEVFPISDTQYQYRWTLTNLGSGAAIAFLGS